LSRITGLSLGCGGFDADADADAGPDADTGFFILTISSGDK
jgi:hypothetical protein